MAPETGQAGSVRTPRPPVDPDARAENHQQFAQKIGEALAAFERADAATAARIAVEVLEAEPRHGAMLQLLARIREAERKPAAVRALLARLLEGDPTNLWAMNRLCQLELSQGNLEKAEIHARAAVRLAPTLPQAHNLMAMLMTEAHQPVVAVHHCRGALELGDERYPIVLSNLALNLRRLGRVEEARSLYREMTAAAPDNVRTWIAFAQLEEADRRFEAAHAVLDEVERRAPNSSALALTRATVLGRQGRYEEALGALQRSRRDETVRLRPVEQLERGRLLDRMGRYDEAWADFAAGKARALELGAPAYLRDEARELAERLRQYFRRSRLDLLPRAPARQDVPQPIFILGFPRSGTTLVEQTLSSVDAIAAGDELPLLREIAAVAPRLLASPLPYPEALSEVWLGDRRHGFETLRDHYLLRAAQMGLGGEGARFFTDKMPLNEVHMGLIGLIFPAAPLLHVIRHPLDVMVSAMSNFFTHGGYCASKLETAATHLVLTHDLVAHYRTEMDLRYVPVRYEDVVMDQERTVRGLFEAIGVAFEEKALRFEENTRYARTASYAQVTEKLYDRSCYRFRNYRRHLEPALPILAPLIERLGYAID
ncbi:tetratricopeptide repeat-containing sulfotransferase family protein [Jiella sonneratiae]|uniref:tetratricopeptide repeat-containing sulfotransferase family protein n=1 Tax=Jiella sonneratiae TaxID=2816856 RepID=UPI00315AB85D